MTSIKVTIIHHCLCWLGDLHRMDLFKLPKKMDYGELTDETRPQGAPKMCYKDQLKCTMKATNINLSMWEQTARDSTAEWKTTRHGTMHFEEKKNDIVEEKSNANGPTLFPPWLVNIVHHRLGSQAFLNINNDRVRSTWQNPILGHKWESMMMILMDWYNRCWLYPTNSL